MSSTPLFDSIARSAETTPVRPAVARATSTPAPASPLAAPLTTAQSAVVPSELAAAIDDIPTRMVRAAEREFRISDEQRALVEALGDSFIRVVVDTLAGELERIVRDRTVRA